MKVVFCPGYLKGDYMELQMKASTVTYMIIGIISVVIVGLVAATFYGSGGLYLLLVVFSSFVSVFFVSVISSGLQTTVDEEFGDETIGEAFSDARYDMGYRVKRFRDKILFK